MDFHTYPALKNTKHEWMKIIPEDWDVMNLNHAVRMKSGESITSLEIAPDGEYPVFGGNGIRGYFDSYTHDGSFVLIGRQGALCGNIKIANGKFWASEHAVVVTPDRDLNISWLGYLLTTMDLNQYSVSAAQPGLSVENIGRLKIPFPKIEEQNKIAKFLDYKTQQIDRLIEKKKALIEKLNEQRIAVITQVVTKGLDKNAKMKPSGVDWLGDVPEHWQVRRIKFSLKDKAGAIKTGPFGSQLKSEEMTGGDYKIYNQKNVIQQDLSLGDEYIDDEKFKQLSAFEVFVSDLLVTTRGTIGKCIEVPINSEKGILHPCLMRLQFKDEEFLNEYFIWLLQESGLLLKELVLSSNATTLEVIYSDTLKNITTPLPPIIEQKEIVEYVKEESKHIDSMRLKIASAIEMLNEYRSALITGAVTGKIDVRNAAIGEVAE